MPLNKLNKTTTIIIIIIAPFSVFNFRFTFSFSSPPTALSILPLYSLSYSLFSLSPNSIFLSFSSTPLSSSVSLHFLFFFTQNSSSSFFLLSFLLCSVFLFHSFFFWNSSPLSWPTIKSHWKHQFQSDHRS